MKAKIIPWLLLPILAAHSHATEYNGIQADKSQLGFTFRQMGVPVEGHFRKFSGELDFDPAKSDKAKVSLVIELGSIDTGSKEADQEALGKQWFHVKAMPTATFASTRIRALGNNRYEATGTLTLKGKTREVTAPVSFKPEAGAGLFEGGFTLKRTEFGIGEGPWADFDTVGNDIQIKFRITTPAKSGNKK